MLSYLDIYLSTSTSHINSAKGHLQKSKKCTPKFMPILGIDHAKKGKEGVIIGRAGDFQA